MFLGIFNKFKQAQPVVLSLFSALSGTPRLALPHPHHFRQLPSYTCSVGTVTLADRGLGAVQTVLTTELRKQIQLDAFEMFKRDLNKIGPGLVDPSLERNLNTHLSRNEWFENFIDNSVPAEKRAQAAQISSDLFYSYFNDKPFARLPYLQYTRVSPKKVQPEIEAIVKYPLSRSYPENHTVNLSSYVAERFSPSLLEFLAHSTAQLYAHLGSCEEALAYHRAQGYRDAYQYMSARKSVDSPYFVLVHPTQKPRFIGCGLVGQDTLNRFFDIVGPWISGPQAQIVEHKVRAPLFQFNSVGNSLQIQPDDKVILGFQNSVWWALHTGKDGQDWTRTLLTTGSTEASLYENRRTGQRVINSALVYGDQMLDVLKSFYDKGARNFVHLGTAGALQGKFELGDVLLPDHFINKEHKRVDLPNRAVELGLGRKISARVYDHVTQTWVPTIIQETKPVLDKLVKEGSDSVDIEGLYLADFIKQHPECKSSQIMVVSDTPFGSHTYADENVTRGLPMQRIRELVPWIVGQ